MSISRAVIRQKAEALLKAAGTDREPVSLRDIVSTLNLSLVSASREPFAGEAALVEVGDTHAI